MTFDYKARLKTSIRDESIGKLLNNLRMDSSFFTQSNLSSPWAIQMPLINNCMVYHIVVEGRAVFCVDNIEIELSKGDFILFPKGEGHTLNDGNCTTFTPLAQLPIQTVTERYETLSFGGCGASTEMVCGTLLFQHPLVIKLLGILPSHIVIRRETETTSNIVSNISTLLKAETTNIGVGADSMIARLSEILVITAMRQHLFELNDDKLGWLRALEDERIGNALKIIHETPEHHWSLDEIAQKVGMSRTSLAQKFKRLVGNTPMEYLTEWRMSLAFTKLQLSKDSILAIALDIGYQSESAFSRAFKKVIGQSPNEVRKAYKASA